MWGRGSSASNLWCGGRGSSATCVEGGVVVLLVVWGRGSSATSGVGEGY